MILETTSHLGGRLVLGMLEKFDHNLFAGVYHISEPSRREWSICCALESVKEEQVFLL